ncbi:MAG: hypothetical protein M4579_001301 [Chaenotheca gracillima]|nr:MAG: hypothetical protein M4579_001301 [Chaenotheca gracillima]
MEAAPGGQSLPQDGQNDIPHRPKNDTAEQPRQQAQPAVRFSSKNQEFEPPPGSLQTSSALTAEETPPDEASSASEPTQEALSLSKTLQHARLQTRRLSDFNFEPVSLPASRVPSRDESNSRPPSRSSPRIQPSPKQSPSPHAMQSPPLTPAASQGQDPKDVRSGEGASLSKVHPDPITMTPQTSPPRHPSSGSIGRTFQVDQSDPSTTTSRQVSTSAGQVSSPPTSVSGESGPTSSQIKHGVNFTLGGGSSESLPPSREGSPSGTSTPFTRPFTPAGDRDDPYARSKRPPQSRNLDGIDSRFIFGGKDARRGNSQSNISTQPRSSYAESRVQDDKRHSTASTGPAKNHHAHLQEEASSLAGHKQHGSMSELKRFFHLGHKGKRSQSPSASLKSSKSGTRTPPHSAPQTAIPFADDHGLSSRLGKFGKVLGSGAGGSVRLMKRSSDGTTFAVKEFRTRHAYETEKEYSKKVTAEFCIGSTLHHGNIIETLDIVHEKGKWYEVMEYAPFDLFAIVMTGKMSKEEVTCTFLQIVAGVTYLHSMGLAHRDLKLDNVVVNDRGIMKLIDFGSASVYRYPFETDIVPASGIVGSDPYLAPEVYDYNKYDPQPTDIWSLAIIYCCMTLRRFPWKLPRASDNSFKLFASPPSPSQSASDANSRRTSQPRPKSTADLDNYKAPDAPSGANSQPASRQTSEENSTKPGHHHHHHHSSKPHGQSEPVTRSEGTPAASQERKGSEGNATPASAIRGPWRLLRLLPRESRSIIGLMLELDPKRRATLEDVLDDPWVAKTPVCQQLDNGQVINAPGHTHTLEPGAEVAAQPTKK